MKSTPLRQPSHAQKSLKKRLSNKEKSEIVFAANVEIARLIDLIKKKRTELGYSQNDVADFLGIQQYKYQQIEARKSNDFKTYDFIKLCILLEIDYI